MKAIDEIRKLVTEDENHTIGALLKIYRFQTDDEQDANSTRYQNGIGFNGVDAGIMSSFAAQYIRKGFLSEKQVKLAQAKMGKYSAQLLSAGYEPIDAKKKPATPPPTQTKMVDFEKNLLRLSFAYDADLIARVKGLPKRKWDADARQWTVPYDIVAVSLLLDWGFGLGKELQERFDNDTAPPQTINNIPGLKLNLFPYQWEGVEFIENHHGRALIGDEMGLGKTCQALAWLQLHPELRPAIIVCPSSLKGNWVREAHKFMMNPMIQTLEGATGNPGAIMAQIIVVNYDILTNKYETFTDPQGKKKKRELSRTGWVDYLCDIRPAVVIADEVHYVKDSKALRTKALQKLVARAPHYIALSGTPITNRPIELFNALNMIDPSRWNSFWGFAQRYCGAHHNGFGWDFTGSSNTEELHKILTETCMVRRLKHDVLKDLPDKIRTVIPVKITNYPEYRRAEADFLAFLKTVDPKKAAAAERAEALAKIEALKQLTIKGKIDACCEWIEDYLSQNGKLVVFCSHQNTIDVLAKKFAGRNVVIDGRVPGHKRMALVDTFMKDPACDLFLGNLKAAGAGLNLTAASATLTIEFGWTPGDHDQAEDRVHRIGQKADSVFAYYIIGENTIEEDIAELIDQKREILTAVLDGKSVEDTALFSQLLKKLKGDEEAAA